MPNTILKEFFDFGLKSVLTETFIFYHFLYFDPSFHIIDHSAYDHHKGILVLSKNSLPWPSHKKIRWCSDPSLYHSIPSSVENREGQQQADSLKTIDFIFLAVLAQVPINQGAQCTSHYHYCLAAKRRRLSSRRRRLLKCTYDVLPPAHNNKKERELLSSFQPMDDLLA
jgi:hypothetical protein